MESIKKVLISLGYRVGEETTVSIDRIKQTTMVREKLNEGRVEYFVMQLEEGDELDPILLHHDHQIIDGRTRLAAYERKGKKKAKVYYLKKQLNQEELITLALKCNSGGSLPPTKGDIEFTIKSMLREGIERKRIIELIDFMPGKMLSRIISIAEGHLQKDIVRQATTAVIKGNKTVAEAAAEFKVTERSIKKELDPGSFTTSQSDEIGKFKTAINKQRKVLNQKVEYQGGKMIQFALDGVLGEKEHENIQKYLKEEKNSAVHALDSMSDRIKKAYEASKKGRKQ